MFIRFVTTICINTNTPDLRSLKIFSPPLRSGLRESSKVRMHASYARLLAYRCLCAHTRATCACSRMWVRTYVRMPTRVGACVHTRAYAQNL